MSKNHSLYFILNTNCYHDFEDDFRLGTTTDICVLNSPPEALRHPILKILHLSSFKTA